MLDYLRPEGKTLEGIFGSQLEHAVQKRGDRQSIRLFCAGLICLPRPIPVVHLAAVIGLNHHDALDLCSDLAPGVRVRGETIGFADEDFEHFIRIEAESHIPAVRKQIAIHFLSLHESNAYAAAYLAEALLDAGRGSEVLKLVQSEQEPRAIGDPVVRREAQLRRLRVAMKVCRDSGNDVDALLTLLIGAEALKTDAAMREVLVQNPDLATRFARDTAGRVVLREPGLIKHHGPLLFHLMAVDSRRDDGISVRESHRHLQAWLQRRTEQVEATKKAHPHWGPNAVTPWPIDIRDIAAETEAVIRIGGPGRGVEYLRRWRPSTIAVDVAMLLSEELIAGGDVELVERCVKEAPLSAPWDLFVLVPLALAGRTSEVERLETSAARLH
ncbi:MAG: hypothetical protein GY725_00880, partial [bacterium]|nr:hypothetical protein [bacterium]